MVRPKFDTLLKLIASILLISIAGGCTSLAGNNLESTKPNEPYSGPYPSIFFELSDKNPLLAQELSKLPELQDGISQEEAAALETLIKVYNVNADKFDTAFEKMNNVGIPEVRKYCAPVQALFWLSVDGKHRELNKIIATFSLDGLLTSAWNFGSLRRVKYRGKVLELSEDQANEIVERLNRENELGWLKGKDLTIINDVLLSYYKENPNIFMEEAREIIKNSLVKTNKSKYALRWEDFGKVIDRLNAPELIEYWMARNFRYDWNKFAIYRPVAFPQSAKRSIKTKKGICIDAANLGYTCLKRAGYDATGLNVYFAERTRVGGIMHSVCLIKRKENDEIRYYTLADTNALGYIAGPFSSIESAAEAVAVRCGVSMDDFHTGMPLFDHTRYHGN